MRNYVSLVEDMMLTLVIIKMTMVIVPTTNIVGFSSSCE